MAHHDAVAGRVESIALTDRAETCIEFAVGGEKINNGVKQEGAKCRVFHIFEINESTLKEISNYLLKLHTQGLTIKVAMQGGGPTPDPDLDEYVKKDVDALINLLEEWGIFPEFNETYKNRGDYDIEKENNTPIQFSDTPLGVVINDDNSVSFITDIYGKNGNE